MKNKSEKEWLEMNLITKKCRLSRIEYFESGYFCIEYFLEGETELKFRAVDIDWIKKTIDHQKSMCDKYEDYKFIDEEEKKLAKEELEKKKAELTLF